MRPTLLLLPLAVLTSCSLGSGVSMSESVGGEEASLQACAELFGEATEAARDVLDIEGDHSWTVRTSPAEAGKRPALSCTLTPADPDKHAPTIAMIADQSEMSPSSGNHQYSTTHDGWQAAALTIAISIPENRTAAVQDWLDTAVKKVRE